MSETEIGKIIDGLIAVMVVVAFLILINKIEKK